MIAFAINHGWRWLKLCLEKPPTRSRWSRYPRDWHLPRTRGIMLAFLLLGMVVAGLDFNGAEYRPGRHVWDPPRRVDDYSWVLVITMVGVACGAAWMVHALRRRQARARGGLLCPRCLHAMDSPAGGVATGTPALLAAQADSRTAAADAGGDAAIGECDQRVFCPQCGLRAGLDLVLAHWWIEPGAADAAARRAALVRRSE